MFIDLSLLVSKIAHLLLNLDYSDFVDKWRLAVRSKVDQQWPLNTTLLNFLCNKKWQIIKIEKTNILEKTTPFSLDMFCRTFDFISNFWTSKILQCILEPLQFNKTTIEQIVNNTLRAFIIEQNYNRANSDWVELQMQHNQIARLN